MNLKNLIDLYNDEIKPFISVGEIKEIPFFKKEPLLYIFDKELLSYSIKTENCIEKEFVVEKLDNKSSYSCKILRFNRNSSVFRLEKDLKIIDEIIILLNDILQKVSKTHKEIVLFYQMLYNEVTFFFLRGWEKSKIL